MFDDEDVGYEEMGYEEMGASLAQLIGRARANAARGKLPRGIVRATPRRQVVNYAPPPIGSTAPAGAGRLAEKLIPLGLGRFVFTNAGAVTQNIFSVVPQRDFQGERLVIDVVRSGAAGIGVGMTAFTVGDIPQMPASASAPASMFRPESWGSAIDVSPCKGGLTIALTISLSALPAGADTVTVECGLFGRVVGQ